MQAVSGCGDARRRSALIAVGAWVVLATAACGPDPRYSEPVDKHPPVPGPDRIGSAPVQRPEPVPAVSPKAMASTAELLYPRHEGDTWELATTTGAGSETLVVQVAGSRTDVGMTAFTVETKRRGQIAQIEGYISDDTGVYRVSAGADGSAQIDPRMPLLRLPFKPADSWAWQGKLVSGKTETKASAKFFRKPPEPVKTKAGQFQAYKLVQLLTLELPEGARTIQTTMWLAEGVGLVKQETDDGANSTSAELTRYQVKR